MKFTTSRFFLKSQFFILILVGINFIFINPLQAQLNRYGAIEKIELSKFPMLNPDGNNWDADKGVNRKNPDIHIRIRNSGKEISRTESSFNDNGVKHQAQSGTLYTWIEDDFSPIVYFKEGGYSIEFWDTDRHNKDDRMHRATLDITRADENGVIYFNSEGWEYKVYLK